MSAKPSDSEKLGVFLTVYLVVCVAVFVKQDCASKPGKQGRIPARGPKDQSDGISFV